MKVFLTGATGFLGRFVAKALASQGHELFCLVRDQKKAQRVLGDTATFVLGSLEDTKSYAEALSKCDAVVHVAGLVKARSRDEFFKVNADASKTLVERTKDGKRFIYISSIAAQGPSPRKEERPEDLVEMPLTCYGKSKLKGEKAVLRHAHRLSVTILRPPIIYGPFDEEFSKVFVVAQKLGILPCINRNQVVSMIYVADCANAISLLLKTEKTANLMYTCDDGAMHTWEDIAMTLGQSLGKKVHIVPTPRFLAFLGAGAWELWGKIFSTPVVMSTDKVKEALADYWVAGNSALQKDLGFVPQTSLLDGFKNTVEHLRHEGRL
jgi:nucleoside-diphosphate-sugar epimerase